MNETKSKLISMAVLLALFLAAVAFASHYDSNENGYAAHLSTQQNANSMSNKKRNRNSNSNSNMDSNMNMNSNTSPSPTP